MTVFGRDRALAEDIRISLSAACQPARRIAGVCAVHCPGILRLQSAESNFCESICMDGSAGGPRARCLCLDIETSRQDRLALREIGVFRPDLDARLRLSAKAPDFVRRLDGLTEGAAFVLGHNVIAFDQPALAALHPGLLLHRLPLIDTLELSPVAFPQNPYHRLV
ncbi:MAG: hypothetical protein KDA57_21525, partial [Planctomycetales bacterium]|nr:hypothetical protein [Planctomycetales bacterium]